MTTKTNLLPVASCSPASTMKTNSVSSNTVPPNPVQHLRPSLKVNGRYNKAKTKTVITTTSTHNLPDDATNSVERTLKDNPNSRPFSFRNEFVKERYSHKDISVIVEDASCVAVCMAPEKIADQVIWDFLDNDDDDDDEKEEETESTDEEPVHDLLQQQQQQQQIILTSNDPNQLSMGYQVFPEDEEERNASSDDNRVEDETNNKKEIKKRAFLKLWETLTGWMTPQAYEVVEYYYKKSMYDDHKTTLPQQQQKLLLLLQPEEEIQSPPSNITVDTSDIGSSRCAGLMSILSLHLSKAIQELGLNNDDYNKDHHHCDLQQQIHYLRRRTIEHRLTTLLLRFHYSTPMVNLDPSDLWLTLTIILVAIVTIPRQEEIPKSVIVAGLSKEEYRYLTNNLFSDLHKGSD